MSVRIAVRLPSVMRPIATPAQADFTGTPASISASEPLQTVAIDAEPLDSRSEGRPVRWPWVMSPTPPPAQPVFPGPPAPISASEPLQTVAIDDEPLDS